MGGDRDRGGERVIGINIDTYMHTRITSASKTSVQCEPVSSPVRGTRSGPGLRWGEDALEEDASLGALPWTHNWRRISTDFPQFNHISAPPAVSHLCPFPGAHAIPPSTPKQPAVTNQPDRLRTSRRAPCVCQLESWRDSASFEVNPLMCSFLLSC